MAARKRLTERDVIDAAVELVDREGAAALTLSRVAEALGVKPPSLYNHVAGLEALRRATALRSVNELAGRLAAAAMGRAGRTALREVALEFRTYARAHPERYQLTTQARPEDEEFAAAGLRSIEPVVAVLRSYELETVEAIHAARMLRSALHGFVSLEITGGFGLDVDIDASFEWLVEHLTRTLESGKA
jgi:AcrR family transcriptional regulator